MIKPDSDKKFTGSIPEFYERFLVPLIFESFAKDLARRISKEPVSRMLEIAAGTGVVTGAMAEILEQNVAIVATDLNQAMLQHGAKLRPYKNVERRQADALALPFGDGTFDAVVCQFSTMFFPDRVKAYREARRVLKPGGRFLFNVWDKIEENEFADTISTSLAEIFPEDPPRFLARTPHGHWHIDEIYADFAAAGFQERPQVETMAAISKASDPSIPAIAYCQGTPLRNEIETRDPSSLEHATEVARLALIKRFGTGPIEGKIQGHIAIARA